jgi:hypothetical protein
VSERTGGASRLRTWLYARLEEMSFRSGATVAAAVLVLVAVAITLAVMPGCRSAGPRPDVSPAAWIAPTATLVGDVRVEAEASVW